MDKINDKPSCSKSSRFMCPLSRREFLSTASKLAAGSILAATGGVHPGEAKAADLTLPAWTGASARSSIYVVRNVPTPAYSLAGGSLPTGPVDQILRDAGVETLLSLMSHRGESFFKTVSSPNGLVPANGVVVIKINQQWVGEGWDSGAGRLGTSTDLLKGLIWAILNHPEGFSGEVVVAENAQPTGIQDFATRTPANAQDQGQTLTDVVSVFRAMGKPVSFQNWTLLNESLLIGGEYNASPAACEYSNGNMEDGYVLLNDSTGGAALKNGYSYPKFRTSGGRCVSMRHGVWNGSTYDAGKLVFINMPVLKKHCMASTTAAWKNLIGFVTCAGADGSRFPDWDGMHSYFWGFNDASNAYGLIGRQISLVRAPDLNILDAVWVATDNNYSSGSAVRCNVVLAGRDPFAVDWYASEYVLRPIVPESPNESSLARSGNFRFSSMVNQKAAKSAWIGTYPYIDLVEGHAGDAPLDEEKNQMNVYLASASASVQPHTPPAVNTLLLD